MYENGSTPLLFVKQRIYLELICEKLKMFRELLEQRSTLVDAAVNIAAQINHTVRRIGAENPIVAASIDAVIHYAENEGHLKKSELLSIWRDEQIAFAAKCLITIWWGSPRPQLIKSVYSEQNIDTISSPEVEQAFQALVAEKNFVKFQTGMENLFGKFERRGEYHLNGINTAFFTKIFHFYFATHPITSNPDFLPVIADKWMKLAVYAEMADKCDDARHTLFSLRNNDPQNIDFVYHRGSAALSYLDFIIYFNDAVHDLKAGFPSLTPFVLEDVVFNDSKEITPLFVRKDYHSLLLPPWIAGRFNAPAQTAIVFNNILGESYLFEEGSAQIIGELIKTDYWKPIDIDSILALLECTECELLAFFVELKKQSVIADHILDDTEIKTLRNLSAKNKKRMLKQSRGTESLQSVFELADTDYRDKIESQQIPTSVSIELTYGCNEMCIHCYNPGSSRLECITKKVASDELVYSDYCSLLDQLAEMGVPKLLFTGGDPFVKKDFIKILQYAHCKKFAISIYTNGQSLYNNEQYYKDIIDCYPYSVGLSLYSINPEIHERITRVKGSCEKTKAIAKRLYEDGVNMLIKCPIMKHNKDCYRDVYKFAISINAVPEFEVNITSSVDGDNYAVENLRLSEEEMTKLLKDPVIPLSIERKEIDRFLERSPQMKFCGAGIDGVNVKPNGDVTPCLAFPAICGNLKNVSFIEIWANSSVLKRTRTITYADSDKCGKESYCKFCNRCIGQSFSEHGIPENMSTDNCFIAKIREKLYTDKRR